MKAMIPDHGSVRMIDVDEPAVLAGQVLIEVEAYSVNRGETFVLDRPPTEWRPGKDVAGTVMQAASECSGPPVGSRVVAYAASGGWAERVAVDVQSVAALPVQVGFEQAATLPLAGLTALRLVRAAGSLVGRRVLITGASGGVGHLVTELGVGAGAEITAVCATHERGARLRELGAHTVTDVEQIEERFDIAMESVGGDSFSATRRQVRPEGQILWFGQAGLQPITVDFFDYMQDSVGATIVPFDHARSDRSNAADLATLARLVADDRLHPQIGSIQSWEHTSQAIDNIRRRSIVGNAVLQIIST